MQERFFYCMVAMIAAVGGLLFALPGPKGQELDGHAQYHDMYRGWTDKNGISCCNNRDCRPAEARVRDAGIEVLILGEWVPVPEDKVIQPPRPDLQSHVCHIPNTRTILCFVWGSGV
jgi:hypothetical protein